MGPCLSRLGAGDHEGSDHWQERVSVGRRSFVLAGSVSNGRAMSLSSGTVTAHPTPHVVAICRLKQLPSQPTAGGANVYVHTTDGGIVLCTDAVVQLGSKQRVSVPYLLQPVWSSVEGTLTEGVPTSLEDYSEALASLLAAPREAALRKQLLALCTSILTGANVGSSLTPVTQQELLHITHTIFRDTAAQGPPSLLRARACTWAGSAPRVSQGELPIGDGGEPAICIEVGVPIGVPPPSSPQRSLTPGLASTKSLWPSKSLLPSRWSGTGLPQAPNSPVPAPSGAAFGQSAPLHLPLQSGLSSVPSWRDMGLLTLLDALPVLVTVLGTGGKVIFQNYPSRQAFGDWTSGPPGAARFVSVGSGNAVHGPFGFASGTVHALASGSMKRAPSMDVAASAARGGASAQQPSNSTPIKPLSPAPASGSHLAPGNFLQSLLLHDEESEALQLELKAFLQQRKPWRRVVRVGVAAAFACERPSGNGTYDAVCAGMRDGRNSFNAAGPTLGAAMAAVAAAQAASAQPAPQQQPQQQPPSPQPQPGSAPGVMLVAVEPLAAPSGSNEMVNGFNRRSSWASGGQVSMFSMWARNTHSTRRSSVTGWIQSDRLTKHPRGSLMGEAGQAGHTMPSSNPISLCGLQAPPQQPHLQPRLSGSGRGGHTGPTGRVGSSGQPHQNHHHVGVMRSSHTPRSPRAQRPRAHTHTLTIDGVHTPRSPRLGVSAVLPSSVMGPHDQASHATDPGAHATALVVGLAADGADVYASRASVSAAGKLGRCRSGAGSRAGSLDSGQRGSGAVSPHNMQTPLSRLASSPLVQMVKQHDVCRLSAASYCSDHASQVSPAGAPHAGPSLSVHGSADKAPGPAIATPRSRSQSANEHPQLDLARSPSGRERGALQHNSLVFRPSQSGSGSGMSRMAFPPSLHPLPLSLAPFGSVADEAASGSGRMLAVLSQSGAGGSGAGPSGPGTCLPPQSSPSISSVEAAAAPSGGGGSGTNSPSLRSRLRTISSMSRRTASSPSRSVRSPSQALELAQNTLAASMAVTPPSPKGRLRHQVSSGLRAGRGGGNASVRSPSSNLRASSTSHSFDAQSHSLVPSGCGSVAVSRMPSSIHSQTNSFAGLAGFQQQRAGPSSTSRSDMTFLGQATDAQSPRGADAGAGAGTDAGVDNGARRSPGEQDAGLLFGGADCEGLSPFSARAVASFIGFKGRVSPSGLTPSAQSVGQADSSQGGAGGSGASASRRRPPHPWDVPLLADGAACTSPEVSTSASAGAVAGAAGSASASGELVLHDDNILMKKCSPPVGIATPSSTDTSCAGTSAPRVAQGSEGRLMELTAAATALVVDTYASAPAQAWHANEQQVQARTAAAAAADLATPGDHAHIASETGACLDSGAGAGPAVAMQQRSASGRMRSRGQIKSKLPIIHSAVPLQQLSSRSEAAPASNTVATDSDCEHSPAPGSPCHQDSCHHSGLPELASRPVSVSYPVSAQASRLAPAQSASGIHSSVQRLTLTSPSDTTVGGSGTRAVSPPGATSAAQSPSNTSLTDGGRTGNSASLPAFNTLTVRVSKKVHSLLATRKPPSKRNNSIPSGAAPSGQGPHNNQSSNQQGAPTRFHAGGPSTPGSGSRHTRAHSHGHAHSTRLAHSISRTLLPAVAENRSPRHSSRNASRAQSVADMVLGHSVTGDCSDGSDADGYSDAGNQGPSRGGAAHSRAPRRGRGQQHQSGGSAAADGGYARAQTSGDGTMRPNGGHGMESPFAGGMSGGYAGSGGGIGSSGAYPGLTSPTGGLAYQWHEVHLQPVSLPGLRASAPSSPDPLQPQLLLVQVDVTARAEAEAMLYNLTEVQLAMLESLFPRHVLDFISSRQEAAEGAGMPAVMDRQLAELARHHKQVTVLFTDIVNFTQMSESLEPGAVLGFVNTVFATLDALADHYGVFKVGTAGDCMIVAGGLITRDVNGFLQVDSNTNPLQAALSVFNFARDMTAACANIRMPHNNQPVQMRVGMHTGDCVSGVVGSTMPKFTLYGATVNIASRMETTGRPGHVQVSEATHALLAPVGIPFEAVQGGVQVKGKGLMQTYLWSPALEQQHLQQQPAGSTDTINFISSPPPALIQPSTSDAAAAAAPSPTGSITSRDTPTQSFPSMFRSGPAANAAAPAGGIPPLHALPPSLAAAAVPSPASAYTVSPAGTFSSGVASYAATPSSANASASVPLARLMPTPGGGSHHRLPAQALPNTVLRLRRINGTPNSRPGTSGSSSHLSTGSPCHSPHASDIHAATSPMMQLNPTLFPWYGGGGNGGGGGGGGSGPGGGSVITSPNSVNAASPGTLIASGSQTLAGRAVAGAVYHSQHLPSPRFPSHGPSLLNHHSGHSLDDAVVTAAVNAYNSNGGVSAAPEPLPLSPATARSGPLQLSPTMLAAIAGGVPPLPLAPDVAIAASDGPATVGHITATSAAGEAQQPSTSMAPGTGVVIAPPNTTRLPSDYTNLSFVGWDSQVHASVEKGQRRTSHRPLSGAYLQAAAAYGAAAPAALSLLGVGGAGGGASSMGGSNSYAASNGSLHAVGTASTAATPHAARPEGSAAPLHSNNLLWSMIGAARDSVHHFHRRNVDIVAVSNMMAEGGKEPGGVGSGPASGFGPSAAAAAALMLPANAAASEAGGPPRMSAAGGDEFEPMNKATFLAAKLLGNIQRDRGGVMAQQQQQQQQQAGGSHAPQQGLEQHHFEASHVFSGSGNVTQGGEINDTIYSGIYLGGGTEAGQSSIGGNSVGEWDVGSEKMRQVRTITKEGY